MSEGVSAVGGRLAGRERPAKVGCKRAVGRAGKGRRRLDASARSAEPGKAGEGWMQARGRPSRERPAIEIAPKGLRPVVHLRGRRKSKAGECPVWPLTRSASGVDGT